MKKRILFSLVTLIAAMCAVVSAQQVIGSFPSMDGGFEGQAASGTSLVGASIATGVQHTDWTCGTSSYGTVQSSSPRTGSKYINVNLTGTTKRIQSATASANAIQAYALKTTGTWALGATSITSVGSVTGAVVGMAIAGTGIPNGTTITAIDGGLMTFTISAATTAASGATPALAIYIPVTYTVQYYFRTAGATGAGGQTQYIGISADGTNPLPTMVYTVLGNFGKGTTTSGSNIITAYAPSTPNAIANGVPIAGAGIPAGTTVTSYDLVGLTITMSQNATATATGVILSNPPWVGTSGVWTKITASCTASPSTNADPQYGYVSAVRTATAMTAAMDIDDFAVYAGAEDDVAPDPATSLVLTPSGTSVSVGWTAPVTGVDGGGYMVVRGTSDPLTTPNVNGIYAVGNSVNTGEIVVYLGTTPSYTDNGLTPGQTYYYRVYTVDKAFNYSTALSGSGVVALPVELTSFTATGTRNGASLVWKTATEKNNFGFNIERRTVGSSTWSKVGFVAGHGTSNVTNSYSYADANVAAGTYAYRVAQVDNDGTVKTYNESEVTVGAAAKELSLGNYPNPFNPTTTFEFSVPNDGLTTVKIYNVLGQELVTAFSGDVKAGQYNHATFDGSKFSSGVYFYSIENNGQRMVKKMMMLK
jgi:hypothetical protein